MNETQKGVLIFVLGCFVFAIIPTFFIQRGALTIEGLIGTYLIILFLVCVLLALYFLFVFMKTLIAESWKHRVSYHICYHDSELGPKHYDISRPIYQTMLSTVKAPYTLAYIWIMARKYANFKNLELNIGGEKVYVWARFPMNQHTIYQRNGKWIHWNRWCSFKLFNVDKPHKPTKYKAPFIETQEQLLKIANHIDNSIKTIDDVIKY